ncbi:hypothetical protein KVR01_013002 [Diaporthe batatas]|uniref:uncharacterized protein n=1 Tax=Diaporthe batatas TaxID=748121 RepID=UPI001D04F933|nr:uncharacterized protein KVR01_013002 [Diaporthe batatas]KAG8157294.1 hypothetical protein KVR01_013002 [Diaporthe batatas]
MIHFNPSRAQHRRACDRCHQAKSKCVQYGDRTCERCERANVKCSYSPRVRRNRVQQAAPSPSSPAAADDPLNMWFSVESDFDEAFLATFGRDSASELPAPVLSPADYVGPATYDNLSPSNPSRSSSVGLTLLGQADGARESMQQDVSDWLSSVTDRTAGSATTVALLPPPQNGVTGGDSAANLTHWMNKLAHLNTKLTEHAEFVPHGDAISTPPPSDGSYESIIDHTFHHSESFIHILGEMCHRLPPLQQQTPGASGVPGGSPSLDEPSYLMVISTYLRFLEMFDRSFCYLMAHKGNGADSWAGSSPQLPNVSIGSFTLTKSSETMSLLLLNLMESMLSRARKLVYQMMCVKDAMGSRGIPPGLPSILEPGSALKAIRARENRLLNSMERVKAAI